MVTHSPNQQISDTGNDKKQIFLTTTETHLPDNDRKTAHFALDEQQPINNLVEHVSQIEVASKNRNGSLSKSTENIEKGRSDKTGFFQKDNGSTSAKRMMNSTSENNMLNISVNKDSGPTSANSMMNATGENMLNINDKDMIHTTSANIKMNTNRKWSQRASDFKDSGLNAGNNSKFAKLNIKAITTTGIILGAFYICWLPFLIFLLGFQDKYDQNLTVYYLAIVTEINSLVNPVLYGFRQTDIKQAMKKQCFIGNNNVCFR
ncbi:hypothetical protein KUTeg_024092 [Tegillarca granosa]|uniref:G-protein coupled receptors family 1 profile domain-containing protein n=1 Tax=Tegillarca granosa TaxID=220873 RepID=A0ABQ9DWC8_TEGGR|nr:hypothetical protein KUTeg_024092 [Tegillarca granosa]